MPPRLPKDVCFLEIVGNPTSVVHPRARRLASSSGGWLREDYGKANLLNLAEPLDSVPQARSERLLYVAEASRVGSEPDVNANFGGPA